MEVHPSSLDVLANASVLVSEGLLSLSPASQTRPSELPRIFWVKMLEMRGRDPMLVLEKRLRATDMDRNQGRLSIPKGQQTGKKFLSSEEIRTLDSKEALTVSLIEPCLEVRHGLHLKKWNYRGEAFSYVLTTLWNAVHRLERNELKESSLVQLWSFRADGNLCFCLVNVDLVNKEAPSAAAVENMATHE